MQQTHITRIGSWLGVTGSLLFLRCSTTAVKVLQVAPLASPTACMQAFRVLWRKMFASPVAMPARSATNAHQSQRQHHRHSQAQCPLQCHLHHRPLHRCHQPRLHLDAKQWTRLPASRQEAMFVQCKVLRHGSHAPGCVVTSRAARL